MMSKNPSLINQTLTSTVAYTASTNNNNWVDLTSLSLTPGVWDIFINIVVEKDAGACTAMVGIGTTSGNNAPGSGTVGVDCNKATTGAATFYTALGWQSIGVTVTSTTTYYGKVNINTNSCNFGGTMWARKIL